MFNLSPFRPIVQLCVCVCVCCQVAGVISSVIVLITILKIGSLFEDLPKVTLSLQSIFV